MKFLQEKVLTKNFVFRDFLVENYGGKSEEWFHAKGYTDVTDVSGTTRKANVHWFEEETVGIKEIYIKGGRKNEGKIYWGKI